MTMMFLFIIMGSTHGKAPVGFAALAIGPNWKEQTTLSSLTGKVWR
jgi:hypothetical protein